MNLRLSSKVSYEERKQAVRNFVVACYHNQIHIKTYHRLAKFLSEDRIKLLCSLNKSGELKHYSDYGTRLIRTDRWYTDEDAEKYFEWLIAVVNDTEDVNEDIVKQAYNQLFRFLYVMRDDMERDKNVQLIAPYDWQSLFTGWDRELVHIKNDLERRDKEILDILKSILLLLKQNRTFLEIMQKDYEIFFPPGDTT